LVFQENSNYNIDRDQRKQTQAPSIDFDPPRKDSEDLYLPPTKAPEVSPTYIPPTPKPKLNYLPPATPKPEYGPPKVSYLPPAAAPALPEYQGNPYVQAPLPQQVLVHPSTFNYLPFHGGYSTQFQPQFSIVAPQVPQLSYAGYPGGAVAPALGTYFNGGRFDFSSLASSNYITPNYLG